jgi:N-acylneuraminate cytidylyltransferase
MTLAIIPARGGSKGIPGKNLRLVGGKPLLAWSIEHARQAPSVRRIVVSTDDAAIAAVARENGAEVVLRPAELSGDTASSESALLHVLDQLKESEGYEPERVVFLQATSPIRQPGEVQSAIDTFEREGADSLLSVCPVHGFVWRNDKGTVSSFSYDHLNRPRRQDAPEDLVENGSIYIFKTWVLRKLNNRLGGRIALHRMDPLDSFQIDESGDIELIEHLMSFRRPRPGVDFSKVRLLVLDFDGVLTDNRVFVSQDGTESVACSRGDGFGIGLLLQAGIEVVVVSKEQNPVVTARCRKLSIPCIQSCDDKLPVVKKLAADRGLAPGQLAYVGNDLNDLECLRWVGIPVGVADSVDAVRAAVKWLTRAPGGHGAVREVCDLILQHHKNTSV